MFYALSGSLRKKHNTDQLLDFVLNGIMDIIPDAKVKKLYVYDYNYTGCISCYACKRLNEKSYGKCAKKDGISELLYELSKADGIVIGSPVYFHDIPGRRTRNYSPSFVCIRIMERNSSMARVLYLWFLK